MRENNGKIIAAGEGDGVAKEEGVVVEEEVEEGGGEHGVTEGGVVVDVIRVEEGGEAAVVEEVAEESEVDEACCEALLPLAKHPALFVRSYRMHLPQTASISSRFDSIHRSKSYYKLYSYGMIPVSVTIVNKFKNHDFAGYGSTTYEMFALESNQTLSAFVLFSINVKRLK